MPVHAGRPSKRCRNLRLRSRTCPTSRRPRSSVAARLSPACACRTHLAGTGSSSASRSCATALSRNAGMARSPSADRSCSRLPQSTPTREPGTTPNKPSPARWSRSSPTDELGIGPTWPGSWQRRSSGSLERVLIPARLGQDRQGQLDAERVDLAKVEPEGGELGVVGDFLGDLQQRHARPASESRCAHAK